MEHGQSPHVAVAVLETHVSTSRTRARRIRRLLSTQGEHSYTLPPELVAAGARRLRWMGVVFAFAVAAGNVGRRLLMTWSGVLDSAIHLQDALTLIAVVVGIAVFVVASRRLISAKGLLDFGLAFEVVGALGVAANQFVRPMSHLPDIGFTLVSAECVWIVAFPLVVPNTPRKILVASLLAASMGPALYAVAAWSGTAPAADAFSLVSYYLPNYISAAIAYAAAAMVHRYNVRLKHAREIGSYQLIERIGEGGMGEVWRARHRLLARPAALKLIRADAFGSRMREATVRRFEREAQDTATLGSTHTIDVYDFGVTEEGDFYYVMELLDGISLERYVEQFGPMEPARVVFLLQQVCHSLGEAHSRGLVHRDIKPANIFMCRLGPDVDFIKVLDFGLVKHLDTRAGQMLTVEGTTTGTPAYMAPEVALGRADVDSRADIYSLGCVAYYLLTGEPLFTRDSAVGTALAHVNDQPVPPSARSEFKIPAALDALILECLAKDPALRPASAPELAVCLAAAAPDRWTSEAAHAWWTLHQPLRGASAVPAENASTVRTTAVADTSARRCSPELDRKTAFSQQPA